MKAVTEKKWREGENAWGATSYTAEQEFEIELSDAGTERPNHLGYGYETVKFNFGDINRKIIVYTDRANWTTWIFAKGVK
jgi:hypothetical protein